MPAKKYPRKTDNFIVEELTKLINQKHDEMTDKIDNRFKEITEYIKKVESLAQDALILANKNKTLLTNKDKIESLDMTIDKKFKSTLTNSLKINTMKYKSYTVEYMNYKIEA